MYNLTITFKFKVLLSVQNNRPVIDSISKLYARNKMLSIPNYHFAPPYKNIPHNKLKNIMRELINFCFKGG